MTSSISASPGARRRLALAGAALCVVPLGLASRFLLSGAVGDVAGGALYAVLIYLIVAFVVPAWRPLRVAAVAAGLCFAVEVFQLTPVPGNLAEVFPPISLVLGTTFVAADLPAYAAGVLAAALVDRLLARTSRQPAEGESAVTATE
ncbi:ribosomal maturation YjgA family protein [Zhihengliuella salsuginis]|uniref:DUF2809 domain-containing protein n=1 Tax=Zhihengliuella salsuginis TaxID=578222 RepID=A0ABQ3GL98_9MICC|nr:DUF2809 domain-containing protein [Zhihengliuella salsuginis]GHD13959.1 hypothetical protein GCM10008096_30660 [Zhihengliuella salsuginis]